METPRTVEVQAGQVHDMYANYIRELQDELEECRKAGFVSARRRNLFGGKKRKSKTSRKSRKHRKTHRRSSKHRK